MSVTLSERLAEAKAYWSEILTVMILFSPAIPIVLGILIGLIGGQ